MPKKGKVYFGDEEYKKESSNVFVKLFKKQHVDFDMNDDADDDGYMDEKALMQLTVLETGDSILKQAMRESTYMGSRKWACPKALETTLAVLGGAGSALTAALETAVGSKLRIKQEVPMGPKRWSQYTTAQYAGVVLDKVPVIGQLSAPIAAIIGSKAEGKGGKNIARDALTAEAASLVDGGLGVLTLGVYTVATEISASLIGAINVLVKAHYYHTTWNATKTHIHKEIQRLRLVYQKAKKMGVSSKVDRAFQKHFIWLCRQEKKCASRGPAFKKFVDAAEKKFHEKRKKLKKKMGADNAEMLANSMMDNAPKHAKVQGPKPVQKQNAPQQQSQYVEEDLLGIL